MKPSVYLGVQGTPAQDPTQRCGALYRLGQIRSVYVCSATRQLTQVVTGPVAEPRPTRCTGHCLYAAPWPADQAAKGSEEELAAGKERAELVPEPQQNHSANVGRGSTRAWLQTAPAATLLEQHSTAGEPEDTALPETGQDIFTCQYLRDTDHSRESQPRMPPPLKPHMTQPFCKLLVFRTTITAQKRHQICPLSLHHLGSATPIQNLGQERKKK